MTRQDKMKINYLLVKMKQMEDEFERYKLFDNQIEADYNRVFDWCVTNRTMLDEQCRKIGDLKAENKQLKTECALLDDELRIARQDTINVLNELRERIKTAIDTYFNKNGGGYYLAEDAIDDIDELINEVLNADKD